MGMFFSGREQQRGPAERPQPQTQGPFAVLLRSPAAVQQEEALGASGRGIPAPVQGAHTNTSTERRIDAE